MRQRSLRLWSWFVHLPRLVLAALLAQIGLVAGLMAYSALRKRSADEPFPHLKFPAVAMSGHQVKVFDYGAAVFEDMLAEIERAEKLIMLETYIFQRDAVGMAFKRALIRKAREGVKVYVVFDGIGSFHVPARFKSFGRRKNIYVFEFGRLRSLLAFFKRKLWIRDHRKILVVDNKVAYLGGMNIGREYASSWRDTHLKVSGPMAATVAQAFTSVWNDHNRRRKLPVTYTLADDPCIQVCVNDPLRNDYPIRQEYLDAINGAERNIYIANAYFVPDHELVTALLAAAARGVDVQILVPHISDNILVDWMVRGSLLPYLNGGIRVFLYEGTILHSKTMTVDGRWSTVGSANLDSLSMHVNYEINALITEEAFARQMEAMFLNDRTHCREVLAEDWRSRNPLQQLGELALQPLRPLF